MTFFKIKLVNINPNDIASKANIPAFLVFLNISKITAITIKTIPLFPAIVIPLNTGVKKFHFLTQSNEQKLFLV